LETLGSIVIINQAHIILSLIPLSITQAIALLIAAATVYGFAYIFLSGFESYHEQSIEL